MKNYGQAAANRANALTARIARSEATQSPPTARGRRGGAAKILIAVHQGFSVRYLLQTDILRALRAADTDVVLLCQDDPAPLRARFGAANVVVDCVPAIESRAYQRHGPLQRLLIFVRHYALGGSVQTAEDHYQIARKNAALDRAGLRTRINHGILRAVVLAARKCRSLRRGLLALESRLYVPQAHLEVMERHRPDMVVTSSLGTFNFDQYVMRAARRRAIPVTTVVLSWDNTTSLGYPGARADHVIAWTEEMRRELIEYNDVPSESVIVGGVAHFDGYYRPDPDFDRDAFLTGLGLDPRKRTILVATKAPSAYAYNPNLARNLAEAIEAGELPPDCQILIRVHPLHYRFRDGNPVYGELLETYRWLATRYPSVFLNEPDIQSDRLDFDMAEEEIRFLMRLLKATDVLVNVFSTLNIEGAIFDVPLVNVSFEDDELLYPAQLDARFDIMIDWRATHNQRLLSCGGCRTVWNRAEMVSAVRDYLANPALDQAGRRRIVAQEAGPQQGEAGRFIGSAIRDLAENIRAAHEKRAHGA